ncbi:sigma-54-dependent Fis family transcriptional regulator [Neobacillus kokaensis]|uniref:Sigma-54-dependent Fis family transcriptional regulator n=1 Tax=Neobacillus kokaensis TaxID=2759023 RepID=A0ABQ3N4N5_9BACI|nr:sigma-54-dependent Fis family transcriptional regulator [Neobacillus kokaensis]GHH99890.1 sigma-54-dependent Fis family transcriptional regulator [Neobacillus kokaensis]
MRDHLVDHDELFQQEELEIGRRMKTDFDALLYSTTLKEAAEFFITTKLNEVSVVDHDRHYLGELSTAMVMEAVIQGTPLEETVELYYDSTVEPIGFHEILSDISPLKKASVPVVNHENILIGMLTQSDVLEGFSQTYQKLKQLENTVEWFHISYDNIYEGIVVVDENGYVKMINKAYCSYLGIDREWAIGQHIINVIEGTRLHIVLQTGIPEHNQVQFLKGQEVVAHRIPIWKNNKIIGGIGILVFRGVSELYRIFDKIQDLLNKNDLKHLHIVQPKSKDERITFNHIIGESKSIIHSKYLARRAAKSPATILITGESGVGKEIFTKAIHSMSSYQEGPFISVNCSSIPEHLLESELFGYEEGAFTGSRRKGKPGKFLLAHKGTIFLDEIGDMPLEMQAKILRVLQEREVEPVGGTKPISVDFRLIAATNRPLQEMVKQNKFREDLYYRLNVIPIYIPPLRERKEDIPLLIGHYMKTICQKHRIPIKDISKETVSAMMNYEWKGNIRELVNALERLIALVDGPVIHYNDFKSYILEWNLSLPQMETQESLSDIDKMRELSPLENIKQAEMKKEKELYLRVIREENGNKTKAAQRLGICRATLYNKLQEFKNKDI